MLQIIIYLLLVLLYSQQFGFNTVLAKNSTIEVRQTSALPTSVVLERAAMRWQEKTRLALSKRGLKLALVADEAFVVRIGAEASVRVLGKCLAACHAFHLGVALRLGRVCAPVAATPLL